MPPKPAKRSRPVRPCPTPFADHVYRSVHGVDVPLRVWPASAGAGARPWVFWIHGGGIMLGHHELPNAWVLPAFRAAGYHVVSVGYRMTPHVSFADAVGDLQAAHAWLRARLPSALRALNPRALVDIDRYVAAGESAGGILALVCGHLLAPPPRAVFEAYAITDLPQYHPPKPGYYPFSGRFSEAEIAAALAERDPASAHVSTVYLGELPPPFGRTPPDVLASTLGLSRELTEAEVSDAALRNDMSNYSLREKSTLPTLFRRETKSEAEYRAEVEALSPLYLLRKARSYPPTVIWHGTRDQGVPHLTHALPFTERLAEMGVDYLVILAEGASHVFDAYIQEPSDQSWKDFVDPTLAFLDRHVQEARARL